MSWTSGLNINNQWTVPTFPDIDWILAWPLSIDSDPETDRDVRFIADMSNGSEVPRTSFTSIQEGASFARPGLFGGGHDAKVFIDRDSLSHFLFGCDLELVGQT
jgi:hypothetical protein